MRKAKKCSAGYNWSETVPLPIWRDIEAVGGRRAVRQNCLTLLSKAARHGFQFMSDENSNGIARRTSSHFSMNVKGTLLSIILETYQQKANFEKNAIAINRAADPGAFVNKTTVSPGGRGLTPVHHGEHWHPDMSHVAPVKPGFDS